MIRRNMAPQPLKSHRAWLIDMQFNVRTRVKKKLFHIPYSGSDGEDAERLLTIGIVLGALLDIGNKPVGKATLIVPPLKRKRLPA